ncbi:MAG: lysine-2,3-aminomutase-like protein [Pseudolabrys sp.]|nr:lysine-2,3-aminomutase-like protein [Pseudolabrys sp.]MDP2294619.1 lysine-2,3-aminomutase-like protein [Pseudolabrys sp.]
MGSTLRTAAQICDHGFAPPQDRAALEAVAARYAVALPPALAALIDCNDVDDPIARQFVPNAAELVSRPEELADPIGDDAHSPVEGIVHRYPDRVLLKLTHVCAVYCRFCFRREMVGPDKPNALSPDALGAALDYIRTHQDIWEVILTGGDPLVLSARRLREVMQALAAIDHVKVIRIHTRVPIADPKRITPELVRALRIKGKATYVALHVNHARELSPPARTAIARMADAGMPLLAQTVLLKGVNDNAETLGVLMRALVECRIKPYYLHHGDLAPGTAHLRTDIVTGQNLMKELRGRYSGLCQPTYVLDIPSGHGKSPIGPNYFEPAGGGASGTISVEDFNGKRHVYPPPA